MSYTEELKCPRCDHLIPNDDQPGEFPGAVSRLDNATEICSVCGVDEAVGNGVVRRVRWPVTWAPLAYTIWKAGHCEEHEEDA